MTLLILFFPDPGGPRVCTGCGWLGDEEVCPTKNCPGHPTPLAMIPTNCWDCGAVLTEPVHLRQSLSQCQPCSQGGTPRAAHKN